ncbi:aldehyde dehydrogenase family protein (plasmid) [Halocatena salina]|uniref:Aldehyde dehydrogenase family protein n=1 Tax=Halocatena salina TaxID=2934340 RepID=A0A8U0A6J2_9EURY|nr:aldehyde dehydrogenase family protein [Halocatena salina]UPM44801.1 aldehyde dehydrogenase family protein [Halocatena salina]
MRLSTVEEPSGVAAPITLWNCSIAIPPWKMAATLASGNTVVFKPAASDRTSPVNSSSVSMTLDY